jgi:hypothetical protein
MFPVQVFPSHVWPIEVWPGLPVSPPPGSGQSLLLESGGDILLEDGTSQLQVEFGGGGAAPSGDLLLEDGGALLLEDGSSFFQIEGSGVGPAQIVGYYVDPELAALISPFVYAALPIVRGCAQDYPIQTWLAGGNTEAFYGAEDTIAAYCYQARTTTPLFQPVVSWYTAGGVQTGYLEGQVSISISDAQSAILVPTIGYTLLVAWSAAATPSKIAAIVRVRLLVLPAAFP